MALRSVQVFLGVLLSLLFASGCHTPLAVKQMQAKNPLARNAAKTPTEIVDVWNSYAQTTPEGKTMRGLGGRIHFYDNQTKRQAIKVDGDLTVYVFDGNETDPAHTKPLKMFQFKADTLKQHYSYQKPLGHGYNFFLPMDEIGGDEKSLCIIVRFDNGLNGGTFVVKPQPTYTMLAGRKPPPPTDPTIRDFLESTSLLADVNRNLATHHDSVIQQMGHVTENKTEYREGEPGKSKVTTIPLSGDMTRRLLEVK
jgi:hypothetical protein